MKIINNPLYVQVFEIFFWVQAIRGRNSAYLGSLSQRKTAKGTEILCFLMSARTQVNSRLLLMLVSS